MDMLQLVIWYKRSVSIILNLRQGKTSSLSVETLVLLILSQGDMTTCNFNNYREVCAQMEHIIKKSIQFMRCWQKSNTKISTIGSIIDSNATSDS